MMTVHYHEVTPEFSLALPEDVRFLKVMMRQGKPTLYFYYDTEAPKTLFNFRAFGTGHTITRGTDIMWEYIDSFTVDDPVTMFFHLFTSLALLSEAQPS